MTERKDDVHKYDDMLFNMLTGCKTPPVFLDEIFGFLSRRTDFYHVAKDPTSPVGLPQGLAENIVKRAFYKWKSCQKTSEILNDHDIPTLSEEEVISEGICLTESDESKKTALPNKDIKTSTKEHSNRGFSNPESYNGAVYAQYSWSQNISEVDIYVNIPEGTGSKDLTVLVLHDKISVKCKDTVLLEGPLCQKCKHKEVIWSLEKQKLQLHIEKYREMWWNCLVQTEPKLDLSKMDCSRPYEDLTEEAQAKIQELQWNAERKRLGLATSDEIANQEMLRKAWNAEGSPFSGPFDPNAVTFT